MRYNLDMYLEASVSIRLDETMAARLRKISDRTGLRPTDLIRRAVDDFLDEVETNGKLEFDIQLREKAPLYRAKKTS